MPVTVTKTLSDAAGLNRNTGETVQHTIEVCNAAPAQGVEWVQTDVMGTMVQTTQFVQPFTRPAACGAAPTIRFTGGSRAVFTYNLSGGATGVRLYDLMSTIVNGGVCGDAVDGWSFAFHDGPDTTAPLILSANGPQIDAAGVVVPVSSGQVTVQIGRQGGTAYLDRLRLTEAPGNPVSVDISDPLPAGVLRSYAVEVDGMDDSLPMGGTGSFDRTVMMPDGACIRFIVTDTVNVPGVYQNTATATEAGEAPVSASGPEITFTGDPMTMGVACGAVDNVGTESADITVIGDDIQAPNWLGFQVFDGATLVATHAVAGDGSSDQVFAQSVTGLGPDTAYTVTPTIWDGDPGAGGNIVQTAADDCVFSTQAEIVIGATCDGATLIETTTATLNGTVTGPADGTWHFEYGTTPGGPYTQQTPDVATTGAEQGISEDVTGLTADTAYYFVVVVEDNAGNPVATSTECSFTTEAVAPVYEAGCSAATDVTSTGCTLHGSAEAPTGHTSRLEYRIGAGAWQVADTQTHASPVTLEGPATGAPQDNIEYRVVINDGVNDVFSSSSCFQRLLAAATALSVASAACAPACAPNTAVPLPDFGNPPPGGGGGGGSCEDPLFVEVCNASTQPVEVIGDTARLGCDVDGNAIYFVPTYDGDGNMISNRMIRVNQDGTVDDPYVGDWQECPEQSPQENVTTTTAEQGCADGVAWTRVTNRFFGTDEEIVTWVDSAGTVVSEQPENWALGACPPDCIPAVTVKTLCDLNPSVMPDEEGRRCATHFLRHYVYDCAGETVTTFDTDFDGAPYTPVAVVECGTGVPSLEELQWPLDDVQIDPEGSPTNDFIYTITNPETNEVAEVRFNTVNAVGGTCGAFVPGQPVSVNAPGGNPSGSSRFTFTLDAVAQEATTFSLRFIDLDAFEGVRGLTPPPNRVEFVVGDGVWDGAGNIDATVNNSEAIAHWDGDIPATITHFYRNMGGGNACHSASMEITTLVPGACCASCGGDEPSPETTSTLVLCDVPITGDPVRFIRNTRSDGTVYDTDFNGDPYVVQGDVGACDSGGAEEAAETFQTAVVDVDQDTLTITPNGDLVSWSVRNRSAIDGTVQVNGGAVLILDPGETISSGGLHGLHENGVVLDDTVQVVANQGAVRIMTVRRI